MEQPQQQLPMVIVAEGIPPIQSKLVEKMRRWEYVDLSKLLGGSDPASEEAAMIVEGQIVKLGAPQGGHRKQSSINDIFTWLQAFAKFMAVMLSSSMTSKEEAAGLAAHMHLILQLSKDLGGLQWLKYDQEFREWAAAKGIRRWGELNMPIYGRCLSPQHPPPASDVKGYQQPGEKRVWGACFKWNEGRCKKGGACGFKHVCSVCGGAHVKPSCPVRPKRYRAT